VVRTVARLGLKVKVIYGHGERSNVYRVMHKRGRFDLDLRSRTVFTTRRYAGVVYAVVLCPSVCRSVRHKSVFYQNG